MPPTKQEPPRSCGTCGRQLERKRYNGRLEDFGVFLRRSYCDEACASSRLVGRWKPEVQPKEGRYRARTLVTKTACENCGKATALDVHHRNHDPLDNRPENLEVLCRGCHLRESYAMGSHRPTWRGRTRNGKGQFA
jgi:hypothetical protein